MRLALEATAALHAAPTGCAHYTRRLAAALLATAPPNETLALYYRLSRRKLRTHAPQLPGAQSRWYWGAVWPPVKGIDVLHGTDVNTPPWPGVRRVATVHDCAIFRPQEEGFSPPPFVAKKRADYARVLRHCHAVLAVSHTTAADVAEIFSVPTSRIHVVYEGVTPDFAPWAHLPDAPAHLGHYGLVPGQYVLTVGAPTVRKNTLRQVQGYARSHAARHMPLVVVGGTGQPPVEAALQQAAAPGTLLRPGYVPPQHLPSLTAGAAAILFATHYEGFGLPILEAFAAGVPVVVGNRGAAPEVAAGHAPLASPTDPDAIAHALNTALAMAPAARQDARLYAQAFTWEATAQATRQVYRKC